MNKLDVDTEIDLKSAVNDYVTFITVRNPFDRLLMIYRKGQINPKILKSSVSDEWSQFAPLTTYR